MYNIIWCFVYALPFLNNAVRSQNANHVTAKNLNRDFQNGIFYANFISEKSRYLNVSYIDAKAVKRADECGWSCVQTSQCFSFNLATSPDVDDKLRCELLPTDKYNSSDKLQVSELFDHYSIKTDCDTKPCRNGGRCVAKYEENEFACSCVPGYEGRYCETDISECSSNPCQNGGSCTDQINGYACSCAAGFVGNRCETDVDECSSNPCQNGGSCIDQVDGYACSCAAGFAGDHCDTDIDECSSTPCQNGGSCIDQVNGYACSCAAGFAGNHCNTDIDECSSNPCQNGGSCSDQVNGYACSCAAGFTGDHCNTDINECSSNPCLNGGSCSDQINAYACSCASGFTGDRCENIVSSNQWTEYTPYVCGSSRVKLRDHTTAEECKNLCGDSCIAVEWWEANTNNCYECTDTSNKQTYTNQADASWPPHLFIKT